jgi:hypothetical protein
MISQPPRQLRSTALWQALSERPQSLSVGILFTLIPFMQSVIFTFVMLPHFQSQDFEKIRTSGKAAHGEVTRIEDVPGFSVNGVGPKRVFFRYKADGMERDASIETVSVAEVSQWQKGRLIAIRYLDGRAEIDGLEPVTFPIPIPLMVFGPAATFVLLGFPFLAYGVTGAIRKYRLLRRGVVRPAKLLSCESQFSFFLAWRPTARFKATYTYTDSTSRELWGSAPSTDLTLLHQKKKGDEIEILVLPNDERRSTILDSATERALAPAPAR